MKNFQRESFIRKYDFFLFLLRNKIFKKFISYAFNYFLNVANRLMYGTFTVLIIPRSYHDIQQIWYRGFQPLFPLLYSKRVHCALPPLEISCFFRKYQRYFWIKVLKFSIINAPVFFKQYFKILQFIVMPPPPVRTL